MLLFARRRAALLRREPFVEDPENAARKRDAGRQMRAFDRLPEQARLRMAGAVHDTDVIAVIRDIERRGPSDRVRAEFRRRGVMPCDVPHDDWIALELEHR